MIIGRQSITTHSNQALATPLERDSTSRKQSIANDAQSVQSPNINNNSHYGDDSLVRKVEKIPENEQTRTKGVQPRISENEIREAQLINFNQRGFIASETFARVQHQDDLGSIIDTYA